jgi:hypothetical protein
MSGSEMRMHRQLKDDYRMPLLNRLRRKAISNELVLVVGDSANSDRASLIALAKNIIKKYNLRIDPQPDTEIFRLWNHIVDEAEKRESREDLIAYARAEVSSPNVNAPYRKAANLPISNFIDLTIAHRLLPALHDLGKQPVVHSCVVGVMGMWRQRNPHTPNVFGCFESLSPGTFGGGLREQVLLNPQNHILIENVMEMAADKDLLMLDLSSHEAEFMLHSGYFVSPCAKIVNTRDIDNNSRYWTQVGAAVLDMSADDLLEYLLPRMGSEYGVMDQWVPGRKLVEITREKEFDTFMSYFSGDKPFAVRLANDLSLRGIRVWRDDNEIEIGESLTDKIQEGLKKSYTFTIILTQEALNRPWVKEELRAAYNLRLAEEFRILPVLYKDCEIPLFLGDYKNADFREEKHYSEQLGLLEKAIQSAVKRARKKK